MCARKDFGLKIFLGLIKLLVQKVWALKKYYDQRNFGSTKNFGSKNL